MKKNKPTFGHIYLLTNPAMPDYLKVGYTFGDTQERAKELSNPTSVPLPFEVAYDWMVEDPEFFEKLAHKKLDGYRVSKNREFFHLNVEDAFAAITETVYGISEDRKVLYHAYLREHARMQLKCLKNEPERWSGSPEKRKAFEKALRMIIHTNKIGK